MGSITRITWMSGRPLKHERAYFVDRPPSQKRNGLRARAEADPNRKKHGFRRSVAGSEFGDRLQPTERRRTGGSVLRSRSFTYAARAWWWFLQADGVLHTRQEVQRATASTTSVHRPPNQDRRARLLAFPWAGKCGPRERMLSR